MSASFPKIVVRDEGHGPIFCGPRYGEIFSGSFGEFLATFLDKLNPEDVGHVNAATGDKMTNQEFLDLAWKISGGLKTLGARSGDVVVLSGENSFRNAAAATACFLLNLACAPIDPSLKTFELKNVLTFYQPRIVFCNEAQAPVFQQVIEAIPIDAPIILFDKAEVDAESDSYMGFSWILKQEAVRPIPTPVSDPTRDIAVVLPSSGSTGLPKGVALPHHCLVFLLSKLSQHPWVVSGTFLQSSHLFWISGLFSLLGSFIGQRRVFLPQLKTEAVLAAIKKYEPMMAFLSPSELTTILKNPDLDPAILSSLKIVGTGGAPLTKFIVDAFRERLNPAPMLAQGYGMTENTGSIAQIVPGTDIMSVGTIDVECDVKIVDPATGKIVPQGEIGEIRVKSKYRFVEYLGNPQATKDAFDEEGYLLTGDLGYVSKDLLVYITGRIKNLIKYRNMHVAPEEIESLIIEMDGVVDVGVEGVPDKEDQYHVVALVVKNPTSSLTEEFIARNVEENMSEPNWLRGGVYFVDAIPRTAHLKTKRDQLKQLVYKIKGC